MFRPLSVKRSSMQWSPPTSATHLPQNGETIMRHIDLTTSAWSATPHAWGPYAACQRAEGSSYQLGGQVCRLCKRLARPPCKVLQRVDCKTLYEPG